MQSELRPVATNTRSAECPCVAFRPCILTADLCPHVHTDRFKAETFKDIFLLRLPWWKMQVRSFKVLV